MHPIEDLLELTSGNTPLHFLKAHEVAEFLAFKRVITLDKTERLFTWNQTPLTRQQFLAFVLDYDP